MITFMAFSAAKAVLTLQLLQHKYIPQVFSKFSLLPHWELTMNADPSVLADEVHYI